MPGITAEEIKTTIEMPKLISYILEIDGLDPLDERRMCRCLVHDDNHPSMIVNEETCFCFACEKTWDMVGIVRDHYQLTFVDTLLWFENNLDDLVEYAETSSKIVTIPKVNTSARSIKKSWIIGIRCWIVPCALCYMIQDFLQITPLIVTESDGDQT
jgi:hypothetical protein